MDAKAVRENQEVSGTDDVDDEPEIAVKEHPKAQKMLQASTLFTTYLAQEDDPFSCQLENMLRSFSQKLCLQ